MIIRPNYYALKSFLPLLLPDGEPPFSREQYLEYCAAYMSVREMELLRSLTSDPREVPAEFAPDSPVRAYLLWEICLRNTLGSLRAGRRGMDPERYLVKYAETECEAYRTANEVFASAQNPYERERSLDSARWSKLDSLEGRHVFDFEAFCLYLFRLMILEKWALRRKGDASANLDSAAARAEQGLK